MLTSISSTYLGRCSLASFAAYLAVNTLFALVYYSLGPNQLQGVAAPTEPAHFLNSFFFSAQTLTTVGYGSISPRGTAASTVAALEAMVGLMGFALATGLLFGRVSRPSARIGTARKMTVAPYLMAPACSFASSTSANNLMGRGQSAFMTVEGPPGSCGGTTKCSSWSATTPFPLTTIVHPIDEHSPCTGNSAGSERLRPRSDPHQNFDDTSQTVHSRYSYRYTDRLGRAFRSGADTTPKAPSPSKAKVRALAMLERDFAGPPFAGLSAGTRQAQSPAASHCSLVRRLRRRERRVTLLGRLLRLAAARGDHHELAAGYFVRCGSGIAARGQRRFPQQLSGGFVESVKLAVVVGSADEEQAAGCDHWSAVVLAACVANSLGDQLGKFAEGNLPHDLAGVQVDGVERAPRRLDGGVPSGSETCCSRRWYFTPWARTCSRATRRRCRRR